MHMTSNLSRVHLNRQNWSMTKWVLRKHHSTEYITRTTNKDGTLSNFNTADCTSSPPIPPIADTLPPLSVGRNKHVSPDTMTCGNARFRLYIDSGERGDRGLSHGSIGFARDCHGGRAGRVWGCGGLNIVQHERPARINAPPILSTTSAHERVPGLRPKLGTRTAT